MRHICFVVNQYPNPLTPDRLVFVQQLAWAMADLGKKVTIICPLPVNITPAFLRFPYHKTETTSLGNELDVYMPKTIGFGQSHYILGKSPVGLTAYFMEKAAKRTIKSLQDKPDILYGHFLAPSGIVVARLGRTFRIPAFFAYGEAHDTIGQFGTEKAIVELESISGVIAVSTFLKNALVESGIVPACKIGVFPNGVRSDRFKIYNKLKARKKLGLPEKDIIVGFVGGFNERKGILRVCKAVEAVPNVKLACAGDGEQTPFGDKCIFAKKLSPEEIPIFNSALDIFVLPTLLEGCSNAIVEAMTCGVPIISSLGAFNDDILDDSCSIRIDPMDIEGITRAIRLLADNAKLRKNLSEGALKKASSLTLDIRARNIIEFMETMVKKETT